MIDLAGTAFDRRDGGFLVLLGRGGLQMGQGRRKERLVFKRSGLVVGMDSIGSADFLRVLVFITGRRLPGRRQSLLEANMNRFPPYPSAFQLALARLPTVWSHSSLAG